MVLGFKPEFSEVALPTYKHKNRGEIPGFFNYRPQPDLLFCFRGPLLHGEPAGKRLYV
jgi:hypothetical protein